MADKPLNEPIVIWGAGAIGGTIGAYWTRAGIDVLLVDTAREHVEACRTAGLSIEGPIETFSQSVRAVTPDELEGRFERIVLAVKAHDTRTALAALAPHLREGGFVLSAQNGLNEIAIAQTIGDHRTMGCFVNFGSDWIGPGRILYGNRGAVVVGEIDGTIRDRTRAMFDLLRVFDADAVLTDDIWSYFWGKLAYGAMLFGTALTDESMSANFSDPARLPVWLALGREVATVAQRRGVRPRGFGEFRPEAFLSSEVKGEGERVIAWLADYTSQTAKTHSGIYRDLAVRKRKTEVDPQIGIIAQIAREQGVATPVLDRLVSLIHDVEDGRRPLAFETLNELILTCKSVSTAGS
jgi:2-dehydropantoate 2-reductase